MPWNNLDYQCYFFRLCEYFLPSNAITINLFFEQLNKESYLITNFLFTTTNNVNDLFPLRQINHHKNPSTNIKE